MKKLISLIITVTMMATIFSGCSSNTDTDKTSTNDANAIPTDTLTTTNKTSIICTTFPQYDWVREILGDKIENVDLTLLLNNGSDLHNYQPSVDDIVKISSCDLFIYNGGESDTWAEKTLLESTNPNMVVINLLNALGERAKEEEIIEGMVDDDHDHDDDHDDHDDDDHDDHDDDDHDDHDDHDNVYDEHIWLSLSNAQQLCDIITNAISTLDADNATEYQSNLTAYKEKLSQLDSDYKKVVDSSSVDTLLFADRFPFRYLVDDYDLDYYAAFPGCSAETEASFETIAFLAGKIDELALKNVLVTESSDQSVAKTIINTTTEKAQQILVLDSMQSISTADVDNEKTYLSIMQNNLKVLENALK